MTVHMWGDPATTTVCGRSDAYPRRRLEKTTNPQHVTCKQCQKKSDTNG